MDDVNKYGKDFEIATNAMNELAEALRRVGNEIVTVVTPILRDLYDLPREKYLQRYHRRGERIAKRRQGKRW